MSLTKEQENGLMILREKLNNGSPYAILQGAAGTGKSYLLKYLMDSLGYKRIAYVSFTGTAAKVLQKQGLPATTIHKLIYNPIVVRGVCVGFRKKTLDEIPALQLIVVDEFSMLSEDILKDLLSFDIPLLLVGDQFQLPPIGKTNHLITKADVFLTEVHRQALDNPILYAATRIRNGEGLPAGVYGDTLWVGRKSEAEESWFRKDVQIITGLNKTKNQLNEVLAGGNRPMIGHKIMFLKNDWDSGITNGTIVELIRVRDYGFGLFNLTFRDDEGNYFEDYKAYFTLENEVPNRRGQFFTFAYAISCHKSQGQTFDSPGIIFDESGAFGVNSKKWLYTALTRWTGNYNVAIVR